MIIAMICFCRHSILDGVKSVAASTVASLFLGTTGGRVHKSKDRTELFGTYKYREMFPCGGELT